MFECFADRRCLCLCSLLAVVSLSSCGDGGGDAVDSSAAVASSNQSPLDQAAEVATTCINEQCDELKNRLLARSASLPYYRKDGIFWAKHWTLDWEGEDKYKAKSADAYSEHILSPRQLLMELQFCSSLSLEALDDISKQLGLAPSALSPDEASLELVAAMVDSLALPKEIMDSSSVSSWANYGFDFVVGKDLSNLTIWLDNGEDVLDEKLKEQLELLADKLSTAARTVLMEKLEAQKAQWAAALAS